MKKSEKMPITKEQVWQEIRIGYSIIQSVMAKNRTVSKLIYLIRIKKKQGASRSCENSIQDFLG